MARVQFIDEQRRRGVDAFFEDPAELKKEMRRE